MKKTLWSHDFIIITLGTLISAIGSTAMSFALSLVVFDHTSSTLMTGIFTAISLMPTVLIPILAAPLVDGCCRKRLIVMLDSGNGILYLLFAAFLLMQEFSYAGYLIFSLLTASFGAIYSLAYSSLYPDLIPKGFAQRGYSVSSLIYPSVTALFTPVASLLYVHLGIAWICAMEGILLLTAALFEARIRYQETIGKRVFTLQKYKGDLMDGFRYLKKEKGIRSIYGYMAVTNASAEGINLVTMAMFQSSPILTTTMYAFLTTADTIGRMAGGLMHYVLHIPAKKRYRVAVSVYAVYESLGYGFPVSSLSAHGCQSVYLRLSGHQFPEYTGGQYTKLFALSHAGKGECVVSGAGCPHYDGFQIQRRCNCSIRILPVDGTAVCFVFDACYLPADYPQQEAGFKNL